MLVVHLSEDFLFFLVGLVRLGASNIHATELAFFGVFGEGRFLKASTFTSGTEVLSLVQMTPKNLIVGLAMFILKVLF